jgi:hypothetical protein
MDSKTQELCAEILQLRVANPLRTSYQLWTMLNSPVAIQRRGYYARADDLLQAVYSLQEADEPGAQDGGEDVTDDSGVSGAGPAGGAATAEVAAAS